MDRINLGIIGTGWCGGIRAETAYANPLVDQLHIAENRAERLEEMKPKCLPTVATSDYRQLIENQQIDAVMISATPETTHFPMAKEALESGKHVFLEKPIAIELSEADELIELSHKHNVKFTIGYSQRFNPKYAYIKQCLEDGTLGEPVSALVSRHITRSLGRKISGRVKLSPAAMEATHDLDFVLWCLLPAKPVKIYAQNVYKFMKGNGVDAPDCTWIIVTMDNGIAFTIGAGWILPEGYPNFSSTTLEMVGTKGALLIDDSHRDVVLNTESKGIQFPMSSMPGESVGHVYAGPMAAETNHFIEAVTLDKPVLVTAEQARDVMEVYIAADLSADRGEPVTLPLKGNDIVSSML
ncbi:MAG: Gfo/Idh/MocA family oxidoreductase [Granulosicoccus sp.]|nr:Gfo/Idh/MocA family oxidoreductase [Granulosicoccus sp.]